MADPIRIGIVGATVTQGGSGWGANAHVPALSILPNYQLQAVCTAHEETAQASKAKFGAAFLEHWAERVVRRSGQGTAGRDASSRQVPVRPQRHAVRRTVQRGPSLRAPPPL